MSAPTDVLAVIGNAVKELECHEKGIQPRTNDGLRGHGWATAEELSSTRTAVAELVERLRASNWRLENLLAMMPAGRPERADIERDLTDNRAALDRVGGAA